MSTETCTVCKFPVRLEGNEPYCSEFCATVREEDRQRFTMLKRGHWGLFPCADCGTTIEDDYEPNACCSECYPKRKLRKAESDLQTAHTQLQELREQHQAELQTLRRELAAAHERVVQLEHARDELRGFTDKDQVTWADPASTTQMWFGKRGSFLFGSVVALESGDYEWWLLEQPLVGGVCQSLDEAKHAAEEALGWTRSGSETRND